MSLPPVYLVDASVYIFRAWFSMPDEFVNAAGEPTNAVYGFSGFLCSLLEQTAAEHVAIAFDESLTTSYRNEIYPEYKANRDPARLGHDRPEGVHDKPDRNDDPEEQTHLGPPLSVADQRNEWNDTQRCDHLSPCH